jgi:hypothetical protein
MRYLIALVAALLVAVARHRPPKPNAAARRHRRGSNGTTVGACGKRVLAESVRGERAEAGSEAAADAADVLPPPPADMPCGPAPARFNPTEKVRADFPVSFPIDI